MSKKRYIARTGQTAKDVTLQEYGTLDLLFDLLQDNGLSLNDTLGSNDEVVIDSFGRGLENVKNEVIREGYKFGGSVPDVVDFQGDTSFQVFATDSQQDIANGLYTVRSGQGSTDLALQAFGKMEDLFLFLADNGLSLNDKLKANEKVLLNGRGRGDREIKEVIVKNGYKFANQLRQNEYLGYRDQDGNQGFIVTPDGERILIF